MPVSIADQIESLDHALTAPQLAKLLSVDRATIYRRAQAGTIPCYRIASCVRFDPKITAAWLRERGAL